jgi:rhodanese-related sulfurtransferase
MMGTFGPNSQSDIENWPLMNRNTSISIVILFIALFVSTLFSSRAFSETLNWDNIVIIDVRSRAEWNAARLQGSIWIPWTQIEQGIMLQQITTDQTLAFYCEAGIRADRAIRRLSRLGFTKTINLVSLEQASKITGRIILK